MFASPHSQTERVASIFSRHSVSGCAVFWPPGASEPIFHDSRRANEQVIPASTFKIFNSLVALELGVVSVQDQIAYDGTPTWNDGWKQSFSIGTAFKASAVWFFQHLARSIGLPEYRSFLDRTAYGNKECGSVVDRFWLDGPLRISPYEQSLFLKRFATGDLPFRPGVVDAVKTFMEIPSPLPGMMRAKTGWYDGESEKYGWFVGYHELAHQVTVFSTLIDMPDLSVAPKRQEITELCLQSMLSGTR